MEKVQRQQIHWCSCIPYVAGVIRRSAVWVWDRSYDKRNVSAIGYVWPFHILLINLNDIIMVISSNTDDDAIMTQEELETYLMRGKSNREITILCTCLQDFNFISNLSWFIGAIGRLPFLSVSHVILHRVNTWRCFFLYSTGYATSYYGISVANGVDIGNVASIQLQLVQLYFYSSIPIKV